MKQTLLFLTAMCLVLYLMAPTPALAADTESSAATPPPNVILTVDTSEQLPGLSDINQEAAQMSNTDLPVLYPSNVYETQENGGRQIIKTYELSEGESPNEISCESFERAGWQYEIMDITKNETAATDACEHTEKVTIDTVTKDMDAIIKLLPPTMEYKSEDGYIGILTLNIASIKVETAGTRQSSYNITATREYPHLSSNDTSLVPKTITDNGRTLHLDSVEWKTQKNITVDYDQLPESYTAIAKYTTTGSKTIITGYTTTAEYSGVITKISPGKSIYTAFFIGTEIKQDVEPMIQEEITELAPMFEDDEELNTSTSTNTIYSPVLRQDQPDVIGSTPLTAAFLVLVGMLAGAALTGGGIYFLRKRRTL